MSDDDRQALEEQKLIRRGKYWIAQQASRLNVKPWEIEQAMAWGHDCEEIEQMEGAADLTKTPLIARGPVNNKVTLH